jgi:DNA-binding NarL/FixJ family response regulator
VVFLTAQGDKETQARAQAVNPASFLYKPVSSQQIVAAVETALQREIN